MIDALEASPLLTLFLVVATGAVLGAIPFGRVRLGAAGALFTGLALSAVAPHLGEGMEIVQTLGLALFVYTVGISAGAAFFSTLNRQLPLLAAATVSTVLAAIATLVLGQVLGLARDLSLGLFTGALTAAPALDAAARLTGTGGPSVGYSFGYPIGVIVGIVLVSSIVTRSWPGRKD
ncbi:MAG: transporter, partial [Actinomycetales bacterium]|nr:transporter [Actinomycetales bacterium]